MKILTTVLVPVAVVMAIGSFYLFIVLNGYSPYYEGLNLIYFSDTSEKQTSNGGHLEYEVRKITDGDLIDTPIIKTMLEIVLSQEFPLHISGFTEIVEFKPYRVMRIGEDIHVQNYMSHEDVEEHNDWISSNIQSGFFEYKGKVFGIGRWIA